VAGFRLFDIRTGLKADDSKETERIVTLVVPASESGLAAPFLHRLQFGTARPYYMEFWFL